MKEKIIEILESEHEPMAQLLFMENYGKVADKIIELFSQPNGGDRVVNENEPQKEVCNYCGRTEVCEGSYPEGCFLEHQLCKQTD